MNGVGSGLPEAIRDDTVGMKKWLCQPRVSWPQRMPGLLMMPVEEGMLVHGVGFLEKVSWAEAIIIS